MNRKGFPTGGVALAILVILLLIGIGGTTSYGSPLGTLMSLGIIVIIGAMLFMFVMLSLQGSRRDSVAYQRVRDVIDGAKPKRGESLTELMSALSDDDLYEVRQYIKRRLMAQADAGDDDEFESFEALLADVEAKRKRR